MRFYIIFPALLWCCASNGPAQAGGIAGIGNAQVNAGQFTVSIRHSFGSDNDGMQQDNRLRSRVMTDYGFTDWFASGLYMQSDRRDQQNMELDALIWENRFEFTTLEADGFFSGARLRYTLKDGDKRPDNAHLRLILGTIHNGWEWRTNPILYHETGPGARAGVGLDARFQLTCHYAAGHRAGVESFSDMGLLRRQPGFDRQSHSIGPVFAGNITPALTYEAGYAYGASRAAPDHTFKLFLARSF